MNTGLRWHHAHHQLGNRTRANRCHPSRHHHHTQAGRQAIKARGHRSSSPRSTLPNGGTRTIPAPGAAPSAGTTTSWAWRGSAPSAQRTPTSRRVALRCQHAAGAKWRLRGLVWGVASGPRHAEAGRAQRTLFQASPPFGRACTGSFVLLLAPFLHTASCMHPSGPRWRRTPFPPPHTLLVGCCASAPACTALHLH